MFDVTEQKREEETRSLLAAIVAASDDAIVSKTLEGVILIVEPGSPAPVRVFRRRGRRAIDRPDHSVRSFARRNARSFDRIRQGDRVDHFETIRVSKDGRRLDISLTVSPVRDESGRVIGASKVAQRHQRAQTDGRGAAGGRPPQGRVPRDAGPRAAKSARADPPFA